VNIEMQTDRVGLPEADAGRTRGNSSDSGREGNSRSGCFFIFIWNRFSRALRV